MTRSSPTRGLEGVRRDTVGRARHARCASPGRLPGSTSLAKRTANRLQPAHVRAAELGEHRPRRERHRAQPVRDDPRAARLSLAISSSRWIGIGSPDAGEYRKVWSSSTCCDDLGHRRRARAAPSSNLWPGPSSPTACPALNPRTNVVMYCSLTSSPVLGAALEQDRRAGAVLQPLVADHLAAGRPACRRGGSAGGSGSPARRARLAE